MKRSETLAIFAYGSLLFRPGFDSSARERAVLEGYVRSFSQASPDHRGTPEHPGRVVTLWPQRGARVVGAVYFVELPAEPLLAELDWRERAGYERTWVQVATATARLRAVTWIAPRGNAYDVGAQPLLELAEHVRNSAGPSGSNADYVLELERALAALAAEDTLVSELAALLAR